MDAALNRSAWAGSRDVLISMFLKGTFSRSVPGAKSAVTPALQEGRNHTNHSAPDLVDHHLLVLRPSYIHRVGRQEAVDATAFDTMK